MRDRSYFTQFENPILNAMNYNTPYKVSTIAYKIDPRQAQHEQFRITIQNTLYRLEQKGLIDRIHGHLWIKWEY